MEFHRTTVAQQYGRRTLVGNWFEDQVQQEQKVKEYIQRKDQGLLYSTPSNNPNANNGEADSQNADEEGSVSASGLSCHADNVVRYGDAVLVLSTFTQGLLTVSPASKQVITSLAASSPTVTNTFIIAPPLAAPNTSAATLAATRALPAAGPAAAAPLRSTLAPASHLNGAPLRYGSEFRLQLHPSVSSAPVYLSSVPVALATSLRVKQQQVSLTGAESHDTTFKIAAKDVTQRFEREGQAVRSEDEVLITHALTNQALCSGEVDAETGGVAGGGKQVQFPVTAHTARPGTRQQQLYAEATGTAMAELPTRGELPSNGWAILLGSK